MPFGSFLASRTNSQLGYGMHTKPRHDSNFGVELFLDDAKMSQPCVSVTTYTIPSVTTFLRALQSKSQQPIHLGRSACAANLVTVQGTLLLRRRRAEPIYHSFLPKLPIFILSHTSSGVTCPPPPFDVDARFTRLALMHHRFLSHFFPPKSTSDQLADKFHFKSTSLFFFPFFSHTPLPHNRAPVHVCLAANSAAS